jgi:hypothetical protein
MVYSFDFLSQSALEGLQSQGHGESVSLDAHAECKDKVLYVDQTAFMKTLGATVDWDSVKEELFFVDKEGNRMDPNH